jgi:hypothetical protein
MKKVDPEILLIYMFSPPPHSYVKVAFSMLFVGMDEDLTTT